MSKIPTRFLLSPALSTHINQNKIFVNQECCNQNNRHIHIEGSCQFHSRTNSFSIVSVFRQVRLLSVLLPLPSETLKKKAGVQQNKARASNTLNPNAQTLLSVKPAVQVHLWKHSIILQNGLCGCNFCSHLSSLQCPGGQGFGTGVTAGPLQSTPETRAVALRPRLLRLSCLHCEHVGRGGGAW